jgi:hypothetical protein
VTLTVRHSTQPPPSEKPEIGNGKKWFAPRKFSDKIALQMKRQEALEETLRQVDAPPVTSPAAIDPEFSSHPAARSFFPATHQPIQKRTEPAPVAHAGPQRLAAIAPAPPTPATPGHPDAQHFGFPPPGYRYHPLADNYPEHCFRQQAPRQPHGHSFERAYNVSAYPTSSTDASFSSSSHGHNAHSDDAYSSSAAQNYVIMTPKSVSGSNEGFVPSPPSSNLRSSYSDGDTPGTGVFAYSSQASSSHHAYAGNANAGSSHFFIDSILDRNERTSRSSDTASIHSVHTTSGQPYSLGVLRGTHSPRAPFPPPQAASRFDHGARTSSWIWIFAGNLY